jgi:HK97 gp10 family phage protein
MASETHVKGLAELQKFLDQLAPKIERNVMRGALRSGMNTVKPVAQRNVHSVSGELAKGLKVGTRARGGTVKASLKATGKHRSIAHLVEFGTAAHSITAKNRKGLSFGGLFFQSVEHPGAKPRPFMRPALDGQAQNAVIAAAEYMKKRLATKEGLDTSHVTIEGDE